MDASPSHLDLHRLLLLGSSAASSSSVRRPTHHSHLGFAHGLAHQWTDYLLATALAAGALAVGVVATRAARKFLSTSSPSSFSSSSPGSHATSASSLASTRVTSLTLPTDRPVRISITLRNTALWSPSSDPSMPNFAFIEGAKTTLVRHLAANPRIDLHVIAVATSPEEHAEVVRLLGAAGIYAYLPMSNVHLVDPWKIVVDDQITSGELAGMPRHLIAQVLAVNQIRPDVHIEGSRSTRAVRWIAQHVPAVVWVHPRMAKAAVRAHAPTLAASRPRVSRGAAAGSAAASVSKHASPAGMSQGDSAVDIGLSSPSTLGATTTTSYSVSTSATALSCDDGLPLPAQADLSPAAAGDSAFDDQLALTPGTLLFADASLPGSPSAASGAVASAEWSSSSSSSGTTTGTAAAVGEAGVGVVPGNVLVTERLADWTRRDSVLGGKVVEYGLA